MLKGIAFVYTWFFTVMIAFVSGSTLTRQVYWVADRWADMPVRSITAAVADKSAIAFMCHTLPA